VSEGTSSWWQGLIAGGARRNGGGFRWGNGGQGREGRQMEYSIKTVLMCVVVVCVVCGRKRVWVWMGGARWEIVVGG